MAISINLDLLTPAQLLKAQAFEAKVEAGKKASFKAGTQVFSYRPGRDGAQTVVFTKGGVEFATYAAATDASAALTVNFLSAKAAYDSAAATAASSLATAQAAQTIANTAQAAVSNPVNAAAFEAAAANAQSLAAIAVSSANAANAASIALTSAAGQTAGTTDDPIAATAATAAAAAVTAALAAQTTANASVVAAATAVADQPLLAAFAVVKAASDAATATATASLAAATTAQAAADAAQTGITTVAGAQAYQAAATAAAAAAATALADADAAVAAATPLVGAAAVTGTATDDTAAAAAVTAAAAARTAALAAEAAAAADVTAAADSVLSFQQSLTAGTNTLESNSFEAGQVFLPGGNDRVNSLNDEDVLTGIGTNPTLNVTLGNANDNGSLTITPTLNGIATINAAYTSTDGTGLDLQDATGLTTLNITRVSQALNDGVVGSFNAGAGNANASARALNLPASAVNLSVASSSQFNDIDLSYRIGALNGAETVTVGLSSVLAQDLRIGEQRVEGFTPVGHVDNLVFNVTNTSSIQRLHLQGAGVQQVADQTLTINATGGSITIGADTDSDGDFIEHRAGLLNDDRLASIVVTGAAGNTVTLGEVGQVAGFTLVGGTAAANIVANINDSADEETASFTTGSGNDTLLVRGAASITDDLAAVVTTNDGNDTLTVIDSVERTSAISMGAGNDAVTIGDELEGNISGGARINLGEGNDSVTFGNPDNVAQTVGLSEEASILGGTGIDTVSFTPEQEVSAVAPAIGAAVSTRVAVALNTMIDGDSTSTEGDDRLGGAVRLDEDNDVIEFTLREFTDFGGPLVAGHIDGGTGAEDRMTVRGTVSITALVTSNTSAAAATAPAPLVAGFGVAGIETLELESEAAYNQVFADGNADGLIDGVTGRVQDINTTKEGNTNVVASRTDGLSNGTLIYGDNQTADYTVDLAQFNADLATINLNHLDGVVVNRASEETSLTGYAGDVVNYTLTNLDGSETVNLKAMETDVVNLAVGTNDRTEANLLGNRFNAGGFDVDVNLALTRDTAGAQTLVLQAPTETTVRGMDDLAYAAGVGNYDVALTNNTNISSLTLTVDSGNAHHVDLGTGIETALTVNGTGAGNLTLHNVRAATVTSTYSGNVYLGVVRSVNHTIATGNGNDVVRMGDGVSIALLVDSINTGGGNDTLVFSGTGTTAGLESSDTVGGATGSDVLAFGGAGGNVLTSLNNTLTSTVHLRESEFTNVSGFETVRLGVGLGNGTGGPEAEATISGVGAGAYDVVLNNDIIAANAASTAGVFTLDIVNESTRNARSAVAVVGTNATHNVNYTGAGAQDRLVVDDLSIENRDVFTGGADSNTVATKAVVFTRGTGYSDFEQTGGYNNGDVLDIYGNRVGGTTVTQVTTSDLVGVSGVEEIHFSAVAGNRQTLELSLDSSASGFAEIFVRGVNNTYSGDTSFENQTDPNAVANLNLQAATYGSALLVDTRSGSTDALPGNDSVVSGTGNDTIFAGEGADTINGGGGDDSIIGGDDADQLSGGTGNDRFAFSIAVTTDSSDLAGTDRVGEDSILDWNAGDLIEIRTVGQDSFNVATDVGVGTYINSANTGNDYNLRTYIVSNNGAVSSSNAELVVQVTTDAGTTAAFASAAAAQAATVLNINNSRDATGGALTGGVNNDTIIGGTGSDSIRGGAGDDDLVGSGNDLASNNDTIFGGDGADHIAAGDPFSNSSDDRLYGGGDAATKDRLVAVFNTDGNAGTNDVISLTVFGETFTSAQSDLAASLAAIELAINTHQFIGSLVLATDSVNTTLTVESLVDGNRAAFVVSADTDADVNSATTTEGVAGSDGADTIVGSGRADTIVGGFGADNVSGGEGNDSFIVFGTAEDGSDTISGGNGTDSIFVVGNTVFSVILSSIETITLAASGGVSLSLANQSAGFTINGGASSANSVIGSSGNDAIDIDGGNDTIDGGNGIDGLALGGGTELVVSSVLLGVNADIISGFTTTADVFDYNGTLVNGLGTSANGIVAAEVQTDTTFAAGIAAAGGADDIVFIATNDVVNNGTNTQGAAFTALLAATPANLSALYGTLETQLVRGDTGNEGALGGTIAGLGGTIGSGESVLIVLDDNTGSVVLRFLSNGDNVVSDSELELVGLFTNEVLAGGDFV